MKRDSIASPLPDVAAGPHLGHPLPLEWVGMQGIALPVWLEEGGQAQQVHAWADVQVDLPDPTVKGMHMPRLYLLLDAFAAAQPRQLLADAFAARAASRARPRATGCRNTPAWPRRCNGRETGRRAGVRALEWS